MQAPNGQVESKQMISDLVMLSRMFSIASLGWLLVMFTFSTSGFPLIIHNFGHLKALKRQIRPKRA